MKFAKWVFLIAGIYGFIVILPLYFSESSIAQDFPPAITHPEYFYGFLGVTFVWQIMFLVVAKDPIRYRTVMLIAILEKFSYGIAVAVLFAQQRVLGFTLSFGVIDMIIGILFGIAFWKTRNGSVVAHGE